jgi:serine/threonine-protein kinase RsbW
MPAKGHQIVRVEFTSTFEMLDFVQVVSDHVSRSVGFDDESLHWVGVAVRESVINAIKHGNHNDESKHVVVEFSTGTRNLELMILVRDQGEGFDPATLQDPLAPENLLRASGRGIFLIRNFMDTVELRRAAEGGMEVRMVKRIQA